MVSKSHVYLPNCFGRNYFILGTSFDKGICPLISVSFIIKQNCLNIWILCDFAQCYLQFRKAYKLLVSLKMLKLFGMSNVSNCTYYLKKQLEYVKCVTTKIVDQNVALIIFFNLKSKLVDFIVPLWFKYVNWIEFESFIKVLLILKCKC